MLDLSGNLWDQVITVGSATGRTFTGNHGNGILNATGNYDVTNWPATGQRGGMWYDWQLYLRISDRFYVNTSCGSWRGYVWGGRGIRKAP